MYVHGSCTYVCTNMRTYTLFESWLLFVRSSVLVSFIGHLCTHLPYSDHCVMVYNHCYFIYKCMIVRTDTHMYHKRAPLSMFLSPGSYVSVTCALCTCLLANPSNALVCVCVHTYISVTKLYLPVPPQGKEHTTPSLGGPKREAIPSTSKRQCGGYRAMIL